MALKRYTPSADSTITNAFKSNLTDRGTSANMGESDILEVFSVYAQATSSSVEKSRILIKFPTDGIATDRSSGLIPASGSVSFYLRMFNAKHSQTVPSDYTLNVLPVLRAWDEGHGLDMDNYTDDGVVNWVTASAEKTAQVVKATCVSQTKTDYQNKYISVYNGDNQRYNFWFRTTTSDTAPVETGTEVEVDIREAALDTNAEYATTLQGVINNSAYGFSAKVQNNNEVIITNVKKESATSPFRSTGVTDSILTIEATVVGLGGIGWTTAGGDYYGDTEAEGAGDGWSAGSSLPPLYTHISAPDQDIEVDVTPLVEEWLDGSGHRVNHGVGIMLSGSYEDGTFERSYYTKKFFARGSEFFFKRPILEARWDDSAGDDRGNLKVSNPHLTNAQNTMTFYFYNWVNGSLVDIQGDATVVPWFALSTTKEMTDNVVQPTDAANDADASAVQSTRLGTGKYRVQFKVKNTTTASTLYEKWWAGTSTIPANGATNIFYGHDGSAPVALSPTWKHSSPGRMSPGTARPSLPSFVNKITNLKTSYSKYETARFRLFTRQDDWCPTIYTKASNQAENYQIKDAYFSLRRVADNLEVIPYTTGSLGYGKMSYDISGSYFDLDIDMLEPDYAYEVRFLYKVNNVYLEQPEKFRFRVQR